MYTSKLTHVHTITLTCMWPERTSVTWVCVCIYVRADGHGATFMWICIYICIYRYLNVYIYRSYWYIYIYIYIYVPVLLCLGRALILGFCQHPIRLRWLFSISILDIAFDRQARILYAFQRSSKHTLGDDNLPRPEAHPSCRSRCWGENWWNDSAILARDPCWS